MLNDLPDLRKRRAVEQKLKDSSSGAITDTLMFTNSSDGALGPKVDMNKVSQWISVALYIVTVVLGISGNSAVIYVAALNVKTKVTNVFLVNLAIADLIFCFTRIFSIFYKLRFDDWPFGPFICKSNSFFKYTNMFCSVFLLAVISLDRALCVWKPIFTKTRRTLFVARVIAGCVWMFAIALSIPFFMYRQVYTDKNNKTKCTMNDGKGKNAVIYLYLLRFICGFLLPFLVILVCYIMAGLGIRHTHLSRKSRSLKILVILVISFFVCWAPYHCLQLFKMLDKYTNILKPWQRITSAIGYFNSCVNPLLYYCLGVEIGGCFRQRLQRVYSRAMGDVIEENNQRARSSSKTTIEL
ncbi:hypothetical protein WMY93_020170 [Mugilogobius chulae]|uniref:G-protein coupled receptors family 1 profile domain-containing protein n=1 Tax=Mugilogobius chulae TaxID=88201 RepID=A0AAW0NL81_9GOBI